MNEWMRNWFSKCSREVGKTDEKALKKLGKSRNAFWSERDDAMISSKPYIGNPSLLSWDTLKLQNFSLFIEILTGVVREWICFKENTQTYIFSLKFSFTNSLFKLLFIFYCYIANMIVIFIWIVMLVPVIFILLQFSFFYILYILSNKNKLELGIMYRINSFPRLPYLLDSSN